MHSLTFFKTLLRICGLNTLPMLLSKVLGVNRKQNRFLELGGATNTPLFFTSLILIWGNIFWKTKQV